MERINSGDLMYHVADPEVQEVIKGFVALL